MVESSPPALPARLNPFAMHWIEQIPYCFAAGDWSEHQERLRRMDWRGAIVGPHGTGKTTLLLELHQRFCAAIAAGLERGPDDLPVACQLLTPGRGAFADPASLVERIRSAPTHTLWLVDGWERLGWWQRRTLQQACRRAAGLVVTAHRPSGMPVWIRTEPRPEILSHVLEHLSPVGPPDLQHRATVAWARHRGNMRETLRDLYNQFAGLPPAVN